MVAEVMTTHALSQRRACGLVGVTRRGFQRAPAEDRNHQLRQRLRELAEQRRRWGCPMLYLVLRRRVGGLIINASSDYIGKKAYR
jgi:putative transposase